MDYSDTFHSGEPVDGWIEGLPVKLCVNYQFGQGWDLSVQRLESGVPPVAASMVLTVLDLLPRSLPRARIEDAIRWAKFVATRSSPSLP